MVNISTDLILNPEFSTFYPILHPGCIHLLKFRLWIFLSIFKQ